MSEHPAATTAVTLAFEGELDVAKRYDVRARLAEHAGAARVDVDLTAVTYVDSTILYVFLRFHDDGAALGRSTRFIVTNPRLRRIFLLAGLARLLGPV